MRTHVLGPIQLEGGPPLRPRSRTVLAALAVRRGHVMAPDQIADALWRDAPPDSWPKQVQICISELRRVLGAAAIESVAGGYRLVTSAGGIDLDLDRFEALLERGHYLAATGEPSRAAAAYTSALTLWRGTPFDDLDGWELAAVERARLEEIRRTAREDLIEARLAAGEHRMVAAEAAADIAAEPLRERRWRLLAIAQYRSGNQADALRTLTRARRTLLDELGVDPGLELLALEAAMLRQDRALDGPSAIAGGSTACPYKGLASYEADDSDMFFGRDDDIAAGLERLGTTRLLVFAGPSGCGKSSLVRAGIAPALRRRGDDVIVMVPGVDPDLALTAALATARGAPSLVVDQFEEVFAGERSPGAARDFCARVAAYATERAPVIVTVRADHVGELAVEPELARLVERGLLLVGPLSATGLRAGIEGPAAAAGLRLEAGLVELLVRDTDDQAGALPLLSHALAETWERRDGNVLTVEGYRDTGGIHGAVARSAEQLYQSLPGAGQDHLRALLMRLVVRSGDEAVVRAHVDPHRFDGRPHLQALLDVLVRARLVTADDHTVQIAHEALVGAWPRLRTWLADDAVGQQQLRHLSNAADDWESAGRPAGDLYRGARLASALEWRGTTHPDLTPPEEAFLEGSAAAAEAERTGLAESATRHARQNRRLRLAVAGVGLLLVTALAVGAIAVVQRRHAAARGHAAAMSALVGNAMTLRSSRRDLAALLAVEAYRIDPGPAAEAALFSTFTASPGITGIVHTGLAQGVTIGRAAYLADGTTLAFSDAYGGVRLLAADRSVRELAPLSEVAGWPLVYPAAGGHYVAAAWRASFQPEIGRFTVWDVDTGEQRFAPVGTDFRIGDIAISPDGSTVAVSGGELGNLRIYDAATGALQFDVERLPRPDDAANSVVTAGIAFVSDDELLLGSQAGPLRLIDTHDGTEIRRIDAPQETSDNGILLSSDGASAVTSGSAGIRRIDLATGESLWPGAPIPNRCHAVAPVEHRGLLLCGQYSGRVDAIDLATGADLGPRFESQLGAVCALAVSPDGTMLAELAACGSPDFSVVTWRLDGGGPVSRLLAHANEYRSIAAVGNELVLAEYPDAQGEWATVALAPADGREVDRWPGVFGFIPTATKGRVGVLYNDGVRPQTIGLYDVATHTPAGPQVDPGMPVGWGGGTRDSAGHDIAVVAGGEPQRIVGFDLTTGEPTGLRVDIPTSGWLTDLDVRGQTFYTGMTDAAPGGETFTIQRRDLASGAVVAESPVGFRNAAVSTSGEVMVAATIDGRLAELDPQTLEVVGVPFPGIAGVVDAIEVDAEGHRLAVLGADRRLRFFDVATRSVLGDPIENGPSSSGNAVLAGDGLSAAVVTEDGVVLWDLDPEHWVAAACRLAGRQLTREEWQQYVGDLATYHPTCTT